MAADANYHAATVYESVGFRPTERLVALTPPRCEQNDLKRWLPRSCSAVYNLHSEEGDFRTKGDSADSAPLQSRNETEVYLRIQWHASERPRPIVRITVSRLPLRSSCRCEWEDGRGAHPFLRWGLPRALSELAMRLRMECIRAAGAGITPNPAGCSKRTAPDFFTLCTMTCSLASLRQTCRILRTKCTMSSSWAEGLRGRPWPPVSFARRVFPSPSFEAEFFPL